MFNKILTLLIIILLINAVYLGNLIYKKSFKTDKSSLNSPPEIKSEKLPADEQKVLQFPGENASDKERKAFGDLVNRLAVEAEVLEINTGCKAEPLVYRIKSSKKLVIHNKDDQDIVLRVDGDHKTPLAAGEKIEVDLVTAVGVQNGSYGYLCEGTRGPNGIIDIVPGQ